MKVGADRTCFPGHRNDPAKWEKSVMQEGGHRLGRGAGGSSVQVELLVLGRRAKSSPIFTGSCLNYFIFEPHSTIKVVKLIGQSCNAKLERLEIMR